MSKVLLIGGLGYIGNVLYDELLKHDFILSILDCNLYNIPTSRKYINCDIRDKNLLEQYIVANDIIVTLAAIVGDPACIANKDLALNINYFGFKNILDLCKKYNKFIVHYSTCSVYGNITTEATELTDGNPIDYYGMLKQSQEKLLISSIDSNNYIMVRLGTIYGLSPRMRYDLVINAFVAQALVKAEISVFGGNQHRPFIHIRDCCKAVIHLILHKKIGIYNLKGTNYTIIEIANIIHNKIPTCKININTNVIDSRNYIVNDQRLIDTGFKYSYDIDTVIDEISNSFTVANYLDDIHSNEKLIRLVSNNNIFEPTLIQGDLFIDDRGELAFINTFNFNNIKRFYEISNHNIDIIRAFHGHIYEEKYIYVSSGTAMIIVTKMIKNEDQYELERQYKKFILSSKKPMILAIPKKYFNGIKTLEKNTKIIIFSSSTLNDSMNDDIRMSPDYYLQKYNENIWDIVNR